MFQPFLVERFLSENEQQAKFHFAESGVHPMTLAELLDVTGLDLERLGNVLLDYPEVNGLSGLRENIAGLYDNATAKNVLVTVGASEANRVVADAMLEPGDELVVFTPTYQQLQGNAVNNGVNVVTVPLVEENGWALDLERLDAAVTDRTKIIAVVNPNNPTGRIHTATEVDAIVAAAERSGAWIVADEVYGGTERNTDEPTPSFWGATERVIAINSMSKAYGLAGLRLGWVVAPPDVTEELWRRHEYATIAATMLSMHLAQAALSPEVRPQLTARARRLIRHGFGVLEDALSQRPDVYSVVPPEASAMSFVKYDLDIDSMTLAKRLLDEHGVLVVPGAAFGSEHHIRISSALPEQYVRTGLAEIDALVAQLLPSAR